MLTYRTFCSGIEAPSVAWHPLGWRCLSVSEIDAAPAAVLAHHYPSVPNVGDMTTCMERMSDQYADLFVAGTPCQSFSVAGLRQGLRDPRGNLALVYLGLIERHRPRWVVWENVPGVLSSSGGRDFGAFLGALGHLGYGWAYRVLDAQFVRVESHAHAVPQRRRRVFVVGHLGSWQRAAAVLLERESLQGDPPPRRQAGQGLAGTLGGGTAGRGWSDDTDRTTFIAGDVSSAMTSKWAKGSGGPAGDECQNLVAGTLSPGAHPGGANGQDAYSSMLVASTLTAAKGNGHAGGRRQKDDTNIVAHAFDARQNTVAQYGDAAGCLDTQANSQALAITEVAHALTANGTDASEDGTGRGTPLAQVAATVRRLTPRECERLQGFPDDYTLVPSHPSKPTRKPLSDAARYRCLGNSMAVNVMSFLGQRIALVNAIP